MPTTHTFTGTDSATDVGGAGIEVTVTESGVFTPASTRNETATATTMGAGTAGTYTQDGSDGTTARTVVSVRGVGAKTVTTDTAKTEHGTNLAIAETWGTNGVRSPQTAASPTFIPARDGTLTTDSIIRANAYEDRGPGTWTGTVYLRLYNVTDNTIPFSRSKSVSSFQQSFLRSPGAMQDLKGFSATVEAGKEYRFEAACRTSHGHGPVVEVFNFTYPGATYSITSQAAGADWSDNTATIDSDTGAISFPAQNKTVNVPESDTRMTTFDVTTPQGDATIAPLSEMGHVASATMWTVTYTDPDDNIGEWSDWDELRVIDQGNKTQVFGEWGEWMIPTAEATALTVVRTRQRSVEETLTGLIIEEERLRTVDVVGLPDEPAIALSETRMRAVPESVNTYTETEHQVVPNPLYNAPDVAGPWTDWEEVTNIGGREEDELGEWSRWGPLDADASVEKIVQTRTRTITTVLTDSQLQEVRTRGVVVLDDKDKPELAEVEHRLIDVPRIVLSTHTETDTRIVYNPAYTGAVPPNPAADPADIVTEWGEWMDIGSMDGPETVTSSEWSDWAAEEVPNYYERRREHRARVVTTTVGDTIITQRRTRRLLIEGDADQDLADIVLEETRDIILPGSGFVTTQEERETRVTANPFFGTHVYEVHYREAHPDLGFHDGYYNLYVYNLGTFPGFVENQTAQGHYRNWRATFPVDVDPYSFDFPSPHSGWSRQSFAYNFFNGVQQNYWPLGAYFKLNSSDDYWELVTITIDYDDGPYTYADLVKVPAEDTGEITPEAPAEPVFIREPSDAEDDFWGRHNPSGVEDLSADGRAPETADGTMIGDVYARSRGSTWQIAWGDGPGSSDAVEITPGVYTTTEEDVRNGVTGVDGYTYFADLDNPFRVSGSRTYYPLRRIKEVTND